MTRERWEKMRRILTQLYGSIVFSLAIWTIVGYIAFGAGRFYDHALCTPGFWIASCTLSVAFFGGCIWWDSTEHDRLTDPMLRREQQSQAPE